MEEINKNLQSVAEDTAEPFAEKLLETLIGCEILDSIPVAKTALTVLKTIKTTKEYIFIKRLNKIAEIVMSEEGAAQEYDNLKTEEKQKVLEIIISEIDKQTNELHAVALGYLFNAFLNKEIDYTAFSAIAHEIKNTNPIIYDEKHTRFVIEPDGQIQGVGTEYLPNVFKSEINRANGGISITENIQATEIGRLFYKHVLLKMRKD